MTPNAPSARRTIRYDDANRLVMAALGGAIDLQTSVDRVLFQSPTGARSSFPDTAPQEIRVAIQDGVRRPELPLSE